jgi:zinc/manganese transport system substrate-binding protein
VYNGGGYDPWVDRVLAAHPAINSIDAYSLLGTTTDKHPPDEHVFYDLAVAKIVAVTIADRLASIDPGHAAEYRTNAAAFGRAADAIANSERAIATTYPAAAVVATEPVVYYLLTASGLINRTPVAFTVASENDDDPAPADMAAVLDLIEGRQVAALLINPQTSTPATNDLQAAARRAGVPVTEVTETLPGGTDYLTWQRNTVNQLTAALQSGRR